MDRAADPGDPTSVDEKFLLNLQALYVQIMRKLLLLALCIVACTPNTDQFFTAYTLAPDEPVGIFSDKNLKNLSVTLPVKYDFELHLTSPSNGSWKVLGPAYLLGIPDEGDEALDDFPCEGWVSAEDVYVSTTILHSDAMRIYKSPKETSPVVMSIPPGECELLHPLDIKGDWVKVEVDSNGTVGWIPEKYACASYFAVCEED